MIVCLLVIAGFIGFITFESDVVSANIIYVGSGAMNHTDSIQDAIDNFSSPGDTVYVFSGTYYENLVVNKTINLTGEDRETTIINGGGSGDVVNVTADWVNVSGLNIRNSGSEISWPDFDAGIKLYMVQNSWVINNNVSLNNGSGIYLESSSNNIITNNTLSNNFCGVYLESSSNNTITNNTLSNNSASAISLYIGSISLHLSSNNTIENNNVSSNDIGIQLSSSNNNIIKSNNILSNKFNGIGLAESSNNIITGNNVFANSDYGIYLSDSSNNNIITNNNVSGSDIGIVPFMSSNNNIITGNNVFANNDYGIALGISSNNNIITSNNVFANNDYGIAIYSSSNNRIYHNNIINNAIQAFDDMDDNYWDNDYPSGGNYWSDFDEAGEGAYDDFNGSDQNIPGSDGIVDLGPPTGGKNPYVIDSDSQDIYPLINPADTSPPTITNLQPPDASTTNDNTPTVSADYSDPSGINVSSVVLKVDGVDVTSSATVTASDVTYIPGTSLPDGIHTVYLEVMDNFDNLAIATWIFTVDTMPPTIYNLQPPDASTTNDSVPMIGAKYNDPSGINVSSVLLEVDGIDVTSSATVTTSGVSYIPGTVLPDGIHTVYLEVKDIYGNLATASWTFTVDTLPPIITNLQPPDTSTTNDSTPTISADYSDPSGIDVNSVVLRVDGIDVTSSATVTAGDVSYLPVTAFPDGIHTVYLEIKDNGGNLATAMWSFTVEATPPTITNLQPPDASTTNDTTPIISADYSDFSGINTSSVVLKVDGVDVTLSATVTASNVTYMPGTVLSDGVHTVYLEVKDIYGNLATATWTFTVDTAPPTITNLQPPDVSTTNNNTTTISADYSDPSGINVSSVLLEVDGIDVTSSAAVTVSNVTYISGTALPDGVHTVYLEVKDNVGNLATATWSFTVDSTPPIITNLEPPDASITNNSTPIIGADYNDLSGINVTSVLLEVDGIDVTASAIVTTSDVSYTPSTALSEGIHTVYLEVEDNVGNLATITWSFTVDITPPIITNLQPPDASTINDSIPTISADYSDPSGINVSSVLLEVDGIDVTSSAAVTVGNVSYLPGTALPDGVHTVYLEVRDNYGNLATATWPFNVDTAPPIITNLQPPDTSATNDSTPTISADYNDLSGINVSSVMLKVDGIDVTSSATLTVGNVIYIPGMALSDGIHTVYLEVKDNVGNLATATWTFTVDTTPPTITNLQPPEGSTTNDSTPTIGCNYTDPSGINLSSVLLEVDGIDVTSSATVTASGVSYIPGMALSDGSHTVYLEVMDNYGNLATATWSFTVDATPPTITNLQPPDASTTNDNTSAIGADYSDLSGINVSSVVLEVDGMDVTSFATVTASGVVYTPGAVLSDGIHTVYLEVKDIYSNLATVTWNFMVDTLPPMITNLQPPDASTTNDNTSTISADYSDPSGINVSSVLLEVDGIDITSSAIVTVSGVAYIPGTSLPDGIHTVYLEVRDNLDNLATTTWTFIVDTTPPIITNLQPPDASTTNDNSPTISADYNDPSGINVSSVVLIVDGIEVTSSATVTASGVSYTPVTVLSEGIHTVYLEVKDIFSNPATASWFFTVDTLPPIITNLQPPDASISNNATPIISADYSDPSGINVSSVLLEVDGVDVTSSATVTASGVSYLPGMALSDGIHTVYLEVKDNVGNFATITWSFTVDIAPPIITNLQPPDSSTTNDNTPTIGGNYTDPSGINLSSVFLEVDGIDVTSSATITVSNVIYMPGMALSDGVHTVYLEVKDNVGNIATITWSFTVDTTPPAITDLQPPNSSTTNDCTPTIGGNYTDPSGINLSSVFLEVNGIDVTSSATITASGVGYIPAMELSDGIQTVYLQVKDNVDNLATEMWSFTVDTTPPVITNLQPLDASITNDSTPMIGAHYSDPAGINISSVLLEVDGLDITSPAMVMVTNVTYIPGTALSDGIHTVYLEVKDNVNNLATATWSFTIDTTPPTTTINPDNYTVKLGTLFTLTATDGVGGCGVNYIQYKIDDGQWIDYLAPFSIDTYRYHNITYRSVDYLDNVENDNILSIYVPKVPITTINIGTPQYGTTPRYVNYSTQLSFSVIDYSGMGYDTYYYIDSLPPVLYVGPFTVSTEGTHTIYYYSTDNLSNIEDTKEFDIIVDNTPPTTDIDIGDPNYVSGDTWVTSATEFTLNAIDGGLMPVGVNHTNYRIWNGTWSEWCIYQDGFTLGVKDGVRYVEFYSIDCLGNEEPVQNRSYIDDDTPPTTTISVGDPKYKDSPNDIWNVTSATTFVLFGVDDGVGLNYTEYRIWDNGSWSEWYEYMDGFRLGPDNGTKYVEWFSVDYLGNKGGTHNETYFVDNIPPETNYLLLLEPDNTEARLSLIPSDVGSGVNFTKYRIDTGDWINYSDTFAINESGEHIIYFWSADKLGNIEDKKEVTVLVEKPGTPTHPDEEKKETNNKPIIALIFSIILLLVGSYVSYKRPLNLKGEITKDRLLTWLIVVLPFVIAEIATGVVSLATGMLSVPPLLGIGMVVDLAILVGGLVADGYTYKKGQDIEERSLFTTKN